MNRTSHAPAMLGRLAIVALGSAVAISTAFAASPSFESTVTIQTQADHHAMMAADYRARMRTDPKRAIAWFTAANHCEQKAAALRVAAQPGPGGKDAVL